MDAKQEIAVVKAQITKAEAAVNAVEVIDGVGLEKAVEIRGRLHALQKQAKSRKEAITKPLNQALREVRDLFAPAESMCSKLIERIDDKIMSYKRKVDEVARLKTDKIAERVEKGTLRPETAAKKLAELPAVKTTVRTESAGLQFRKIPKMRVVNADLLPDKYWIIDEVTLRKDVLSGIVVPGAERYEEEIPVNN